MANKKVFTIFAEMSGATESHAVVGEGLLEERALDMVQTRLTSFEIRHMADAQRRGEDEWAQVWLVEATPATEEDIEEGATWEYDGEEYHDIYDSTLSIINITPAIYCGDEPMPKFDLRDWQKEALREEGIDVPEE